MKSTVLKALGAALILMMLASCAPAAMTNPAPAATQPPAQPTAVPATPTTAPALTTAKPYDVVWYQGCPWVSNALPDPDKDYIHQYILKNYNINLEIQFNAACDDSKTIAMFSAGQIPDFFQAYWSVGTPALLQLINQGVILPIDLSQYPGMKNALSADAFKYLTVDGKVYGFAPINDPTQYTSYIRQDWLDKLNLKAPTTPDEVTAVAKAFVASNKGAYALTSFISNGNPWTGLESFFAPFGFQPGTTDLMIQDNKVYFPGLSDNAKAGLMWFKQLLDAGCVDPGWSTNTEDVFQTEIGSGKVGMVTYYFYMLDPLFFDIGKMVADKNPNANWQWVDPLTGPAGKYMMVVPYANGTGNAFFVTQQAKSEPGKYEALMKFLDDAINVNSDLYKTMVWGEPNVTYWTDASGTVIKHSYGANNNEYLWMDNYRLFRTGNAQYREVSWGVTNKDMVTGFTRADTLPVDYSVRGLVPALSSQSDLDTYVAEEQLKFVTGQESFDNWGKFVTTAMTTYKGQAILDDATAKLKAIGMIH